MLTKSTLTVLLTMGLALGACGSDDTSSGGSGAAAGSGGAGGGAGSGGAGGSGASSGSGFTGLDGAAELGSLDAAALTTMCETTNAELSSGVPVDVVVQYLCVAGAVGNGAADSAECGVSADPCIAAAEPPAEDDCTTLADPTGCTVTVAEYEACVPALATWIKAQLELWECAALDDLPAFDAAQAELADPPAECTLLETECPEFLASLGPQPAP